MRQTLLCRLTSVAGTTGRKAELAVAQVAKAEVVGRGAGVVPAPSHRTGSAERLEGQGEAGGVAELVVVEPGAASGNDHQTLRCHSAVWQL